MPLCPSFHFCTIPANWALHGQAKKHLAEIQFNVKLTEKQWFLRVSNFGYHPAGPWFRDSANIARSKSERYRLETVFLRFL